MHTLIDGKEIARLVRAEVKARVKEYAEKHGKAPALCVILAGDNPASKVYVASKEKACGWVGIRSIAKRFPATITEDELIGEIRKLNADPDINGILVQLPLPKGINEENVLRAVAPEKDVDGFHPMNAGELMRAGAMLEPCTPAGCIELLKRANVALSGANAVVIGRSNIVGKPIAMMLLRENCTVTIVIRRPKTSRISSKMPILS